MLKIIPSFLIIAYVFLIITLMIGTYLLMIFRFYKNLLTDEGYLMFTLPTKTHSLITSKLLINIFWFLSSIIAILGSSYIIFATPNRMRQVAAVLEEALVELKISFEGNWILLITELVIMCLVSLLFNILLIYVSIAVGQLFSGHKLIGAFVAYVAITTTIQFIMVILMILVSLFFSGNINDISTLPQYIFPIGILVLLFGSIVFYEATNYIFKKKLNLE